MTDYMTTDPLATHSHTNGEVFEHVAELLLPGSSSQGVGVSLDPILLWNGVALEANRISHTKFVDTQLDEQTGPTRSSRALAMVHLAMYDAYAAIDTGAGLPPYLSGLPTPPAGAAVPAAIAAAAHTTLSKLFPSQQPFFDSILAVAGDTSNLGHQFGKMVAEAILADRKDDPSAASPGYVPSLERGRHRVDPANHGQGFHGAFYGAQSKAFAITERHELAAPPFDDPEYLAALREVRGKGIAPDLSGSLPHDLPGRTAEETLLGIFWAYDGTAEVGTPPRLYNQVVRQVAVARNNSVADNARLFALVNVAMADAGILAWDEKYRHDFWRPVVGIREHDQSMGPAAAAADHVFSANGDPGWLPLGAPHTNRLRENFTPSFPAYPSGHATFGAAAFHMTRLFYGEGGRLSDDTLTTDSLFTELVFVSDEFNGSNTDNKKNGAPAPSP